MKSINEFIDNKINEDRIGDKTLYPGDTIICKNPIFPDKPNWEVTYVDKDKNSFRGTNMYGQIVTVPIDKIVEIIRVVDAPKKKRKMSIIERNKIRREIRDLGNQLDDLRADMENDPDVLAEKGEGGKATNRYGKEMEKIMKQIEKLQNKLDNAI